MTIKEIRNELTKEIAYSENIGRKQGFSESLELLNQLSAPELVWDRLDCSTEKIDDLFLAKTLAGNYEIWLDDVWWYVQALGLYEIKGSLEEAKAAAQTHWNELYLQITNL